MDLTIREMEERDYPAVVALWNNELDNRRVTAGTLGTVYARMRRNDAYRTYVAEADGEVAGFVTTVEAMAADCAVGGYLKMNGIAVRTDLHGMGVGRALMERVEALARERELSYVGLATGFQRKGAHAFYEKLGYTSGSYWYGKRID